MENECGTNVKIYPNSVITNTKIDNNSTVGEDTFIDNSRIGYNCLIERRNFVTHSEISDYTYTGYNTVIKYSTIGKFNSISWNCSIGGANHYISHLTCHPFPILSRFGIAPNNEIYSSYEDKLIIGNDVWIGSNVCILRGVTIGDGAVIGAGAVVTHDVDSYEIWAGVPAKKIGQRFSDSIIKKLKYLSWWDLPTDFIKNNLDCFKSDVTEKMIDDLIKKVKSYSLSEG